MKKILKSKKVMTFLWILVMLAVFRCDMVYAEVTDWDGFGRRFWGYVVIFARWGCLCMCGISIIRKMESADVKNILSIILKYLIIYVSIILLPSVFNQAGKIFQ